MNDPSGAAPDPDPSGMPGAHSQEIRHSQVSAIVPEHVARGTFSTGAVVLQGAHEFIIDFLLRMASPQQVAARIVLPPPVVARLIAALRENLQKYEARFGPPAPKRPNEPPPQPATQPSAQDLYDQLKLQDDVLSGTYANAVMIGHTATEFSFDFITTFFPRSAVAKRVFLATPNVPRLLESLTHSFKQYQKRIAEAQGRDGQPPSPPGPATPPEPPQPPSPPEPPGDPPPDIS